jgi:serine/threonine-protein kinase
MARLDKWSRKQGHRTIRLDCGSFSSDVLGEIGSLLYSVADELAAKLDLDDRLKKLWKPERDPLRNLTRFVEDAVLSETDDRIGLLIDNADAALQIPDVGRQFFNLLRSWHNARADGEPWERLSLIVSHRIEPAAWITDLNNSPFNVGLTLRVGDLLPGEVGLLNERYGGPLTADELIRVMSDVSGHPYLVRLLLFQMATGVAKSIDQWLTESVKMGGAAYPLLMSLTNQLRREPQLARAFQQVVKAGSCPDGEAYQRLWELGLVAGDSRRECRPRCAIYVNFLNQAT